MLRRLLRRAMCRLGLHAGRVELKFIDAAHYRVYFRCHHCGHGKFMA